MGQLRTKTKSLVSLRVPDDVIIARNHMCEDFVLLSFAMSSLMRGGRFAWLASHVGDYSIISRRDGALFHKRANVAPSVAKTGREPNPNRK